MEDSELCSYCGNSEAKSKVFHHTKQNKHVNLMSALLFLPKDDPRHPKTDTFPFPRAQVFTQVTCHLLALSALLICVTPATFQSFTTKYSP